MRVVIIAPPLLEYSVIDDLNTSFDFAIFSESESLQCQPLHYPTRRSCSVLLQQTAKQYSVNQLANTFAS